jgi:hypothetical protein
MVCFFTLCVDEEVVLVTMGIGMFTASFALPTSFSGIGSLPCHGIFALVTTSHTLISPLFLLPLLISPTQELQGGGDV